MSTDRPKKPSFKEIAAKAKEMESRASVPPPSGAQDLLGVASARTSSPPPSGQPGALPSSGPLPEARISAPPASLPRSGSLGPAPRSGALPPISGSGPLPAPRISTIPAPHDSGKVDLAPTSQGPTSQPPASLPRNTIPSPSGPLPNAVSSTPPESQKKGSSAPIIVGVLIAVGLLGGAVIMSRSPAQPAAATTAAPSPKPVETQSAAPEPPRPVAQPSEPMKPEPGVIDINSLGTVSSATAAASGPLPKGAASAKGDKPDPAASAAAPAAASVAAAPPPAPMGSVGELKDEMKKRVGATDGPADDAKGESGPAAKQSKPSPGAVQGALGSVRGAAKNCLGDTENITRVALTFGSDGSVKSVSVSGGAAGKPAEACIKAAVSKAKVAPFTDDTYTTNFTIRP